MVSSPGDVREEELFQALIKRFGRNCVYRSPKVYVHGQEKELGDVVVLALPYMIVFQSKWKQMSSDDLYGEKGALYKSRLLKTLRKAASQFKELASSLQQKALIELPQVWLGNNQETYTFPLELVECVVPVVVVDFDDPNYGNPGERYADVPPVVSEIPSQISSWGVVHSFILRDFYRILSQLFTVGDLLYWLKEREKLIGAQNRSIIGYGELTLFTVYQLDHSLWRKLYKADCIFFVENDVFEHMLETRSNEFRRREKKFGRRTLFDAIDETIIRTLLAIAPEERDSAILSYLMCQGRMLCCSAESKQVISQKLQLNLQNFVCRDDSFCGSFALPDPQSPLGRTASYFGVASYTEDTASRYCARAYYRTLSKLKDMGNWHTVDEVLIVFVQYHTRQVLCMVRKVCPEDFATVIGEM